MPLILYMANDIAFQNGQKVFQRQSQDYRAHTKSVHSRKEEKRIEHGVRQDKGAVYSASLASSQPASRKEFARIGILKRPRVRSKKQNKLSDKLVPITIRLRPIVSEGLRDAAQTEGVSVSELGATFIDEGLRRRYHQAHAGLIQPIIEQAIRKQMRGISTRLAWLLVRVAFDAGQTRSLVTNVLGRQPGVTPEILKTILENSGKTAKGNLTRRTPQLTELIAAVEDWIQPEGMERDRK